MENRLHVSSHLLWLYCEFFSCFLSLKPLFVHSLQPNVGLQQLIWGVMACANLFFRWNCGSMENRLHVSSHLHCLLHDFFCFFLSLVILFSHSVEPNVGLQQLNWGVLTCTDLSFKTCCSMESCLHVSSHLVRVFCELFSCFSSLKPLFSHSLEPNVGLHQLFWEVLACRDVSPPNLWYDWKSPPRV